MATTPLAYSLIVVSLATIAQPLTKDCNGQEGSHASVGGSISLNLDMYHRSSCPQAEDIIFSGAESVIANDPRMAASLLWLHFHGCDASLLLERACPETPLCLEVLAGGGNNAVGGLVEGYALDMIAFFGDFKESVVRMGRPGSSAAAAGRGGGEVRRCCSVVN